MAPHRRRLVVDAPPTGISRELLVSLAARRLWLPPVLLCLRSGLSSMGAMSFGAFRVGIGDKCDFGPLPPFALAQQSVAAEPPLPPVDWRQLVDSVVIVADGVGIGRGYRRTVLVKWQPGCCCCCRAAIGVATIAFGFADLPIGFAAAAAAEHAKRRRQAQFANSPPPPRFRRLLLLQTLVSLFVALLVVGASV